MKQKTYVTRLCIALALLFAFLMPMQSLEAQTGTGNVEVRVEDQGPGRFPTVSARVTVLDPAGIPITGLDADSFDLFEDGQQVTVSGVESYVNPDVRIAVALAIDISGSMYEEIDQAKAAASSFVNGLAANDLVAVIAFRGDPGDVNLGDPFPQIKPNREIEFTADKDAVLALIDRLSVPSRTAGRTPLYDAIFKSVRMTSRVSGIDYRFVMVFTDGNEKCQDCRGSVLNQNDPINEANKVGVPVFTIGLGKDADEKYLQRVALTSGGSYYFAPTPDRLYEIYRSVADRLKQQYVITYLAKAPADGKEHKLDIKVDTPDGEGSNVVAIDYPCPERPGVRLFYLRDTGVPGEEPVVTPLEDGLEVSSQLTIAPDINACHPIQRVELFMDGNLIFTAKNRPFRLPHDYYNVQREAPGEHHLTVRVYDTEDNASEDVTVTILVRPIVTPTSQGPGPTAIPGGPTAPGLLADIPRWALGGAGIIGILLLLVVVLTVAQRSRKRTCPQCGQALPAGSDHCPFCAADQRTARQYMEDITEPEQPILTFPSEEKTVPEMPVLVSEPRAGYPATLPSVAPVGAERQADRTEVLRVVPQRHAWLIVTKGNRVGKEFHLHEKDTTIGRSADNDVVLNDEAVSRNHAKVRLEADGYHVYDLAATNPTLVNDQPISRHHLKEGDRVQFGNTVLVFKELVPKQ